MEYRIDLRGGGTAVCIAPGGELRLLEDGLEGFGRIDGTVAVADYAAYGGGYPISRHVARREIRLRAEIAPGYGTAAFTELRRRLIRLMDPETDVEMTVRMGGEERRITLIPSGESTAEIGHFLRPAEVRLCYIAPDPYFRAAREETVSFWQVTPMLTFPFNSMAGAGTVSGYYGTTNTARIRNPGDVPCGYRLTLTAENGRVTAPRVILPDGTLSLSCEIGPGDTVVIDTHPRAKTIVCSGVPSLCFTADSVFAGLPCGTGTMTIDADAGIPYLRAALTFTPLYCGI